MSALFSVVGHVERDSALKCRIKVSLFSDHNGNKDRSEDAKSYNTHLSLRLVQNAVHGVEERHLLVEVQNCILRELRSNGGKEEFVAWN